MSPKTSAIRSCLAFEGATNRRLVVEVTIRRAIVPNTAIGRSPRLCFQPDFHIALIRYPERQATNSHRVVSPTRGERCMNSSVPKVGRVRKSNSGVRYNHRNTCGFDFTKGRGRGKIKAKWTIKTRSVNSRSAMTVQRSDCLGVNTKTGLAPLAANTSTYKSGTVAETIVAISESR